jgi:hypothetical protein
MKQETDNRTISKVLLAVLVVLTGLQGRGPAAESASNLPALDPSASPLDPRNRAALQRRLIAAFDQLYLQELKTRGDRAITEDMAFYYLRQELQGLVDMWRATHNKVYLEQAALRAGKALMDGRANMRLLLYRGEERGTWPCFPLRQKESVTGGHSQLSDFQGAAGLLLVARALQLAEMEGAPALGTFVEEGLLAKWVHYRPQVTLELLRGPLAQRYLLALLESGRDKREHFAVICMDMHHLGAKGLPYAQFATLLTQLYVSRRETAATPFPYAEALGSSTPRDWGLVPQGSDGGLVWYFATNKNQPLEVVDTSHANRTVWLATRALSETMLAQSQVDGLIQSLKHAIWKPTQGPFYFANRVDGTDDTVQGLGPGRKGNLWFGWHRLAAYDDALRDLFISIAYDLTNGGHHLPPDSQNQSMPEARLCYYAWAARLLAENGQPKVFP